MELNSSELVKSISIENFLQQREVLKSLLIEAHILLQKADQLSKNMGYFRVESLFSERRYDHEAFNFVQENAPEYAMKALDAKGWSFLMNESGMLSFMDSVTKEKWHESLRLGHFPEMTLSNIEETFRDLSSSKISMLEKGVINGFKSLSWNYKTNSPKKLGKKIIVNGSSGYSGGIDYRTRDKIADFLRPFYIFDGVPEPDHRNSIGEDIHEAAIKGLNEIENDFARIKWYGKGTVHIYFKKLEHVDRMNKIISKHFPNAIHPAS